MNLLRTELGLAKRERKLREIVVAAPTEAEGPNPTPRTPNGSGFRVQGSWFRVQASGFSVRGSGFRVQVSGCGAAEGPIRSALPPRAVLPLVLPLIGGPVFLKLGFRGKRDRGEREKRDYHEMAADFFNVDFSAQHQRQGTLHPEPCTLHPEPRTLNPAPCTLIPHP